MIFSDPHKTPTLAQFMIVSVLAILGLAVFVVPARLAEPQDERELYRIRIANQLHGVIEVSADGGKTYSRVGKVTQPATRTLPGYAASIYALPGTVAAAAVHGIRIKVGGERDCRREDARIISLVPREFSTSPDGFGGHTAGPSGICTDIPTGESIFRNLSPFVGDRVYLQNRDSLVSLPRNYSPSERDVLVIIVRIPARRPREIVFENRQGGLAEAVYPDRRETIARVDRPVRGVGRFDATGYTGVGRINTNHTGVITISTAPIVDGGKDGSSVETRGGFMIQPSRHALLSTITAQVMVVSPASAGSRFLEGEPPLFSGYIGLAHDPSSPGNSVRVEMRTGDSGWKSLPPIIGKQDNALARLPNGAGSVTAIRIVLPEYSEEWIRSELTRSERMYRDAGRAEAVRTGTIVTSESIRLQMDSAGEDIRFVRLYLNGEFAGVTNSYPYAFDIDVRKLTEGEHTAELQAIDSRGDVIKKVKRSFYRVSEKTAASSS